jgi:thiol-disulfide isomerase/thioredoxin
MRQAAALGVAVLLGVGALWLGLTWQQRSELDPLESAPSSLSSGAFYASTFTDLSNHSRTLGEWQGKVIVLNFWATWCAPCREEIPELIKFQQEFGDRGVVVIGLAIDEMPNVALYANEIKINYPLLLASSNGTELARRLGNHSGSLPFTVVIGRSGETLARQMGVMTRNKLEKIVSPHL